MKTVNKLSRNCKQTCERLRGYVTKREETPRLRGRGKLRLGFIARVRCEHGVLGRVCEKET